MNFTVTLDDITARICARKDDYIARHLERGAFYEPDLLRALRPHLDGRLAIDIGAHVGNHSVFFSRFGPVIGVEPMVEVQRCWLQTMAISSAWRAYLVPHPCGAEPGQRYAIQTFTDNTGRTQVRPGAGGVTSTTVDEITQGREICVMKVDVEGHEPVVLRGAIETLKRSPVVLAIEAATDAHVAAIEEVLAPLGYRRGQRYCATATYLWQKA